MRVVRSAVQCSGGAPCDNSNNKFINTTATEALVDPSGLPPKLLDQLPVDFFSGFLPPRRLSAPKQVDQVC